MLMRIKGDGLAYKYVDSDIKIKFPDFIFKTGDVVILNQKSGKGKSTLINLIMNLTTPTTGNIFIDYENKTIKPNIKSLVSFVPQESILLNDTILNNIIFTSNITEDNIDIDRLKIVFNLAGLSHLNIGFDEIFTRYCGERGGALSGGQVQRIHIARILYENRPILIMDEPTSAIDNEGEIELLLKINDELKSKITIIASHNKNLTNIKNTEYTF